MSVRLMGRGGQGPRRGVRHAEIVGQQALLRGGDFDVLLQFLERADFDLADTLAADAEFLRQILQRRRILA